MADLIVKKGESIPELSIPVYEKGTDPPVAVDLTGYTAQCQFREVPSGEIAIDSTVTCGNGSVTIAAIAAPTWKHPGTYRGDIFVRKDGVTSWIKTVEIEVLESYTEWS